MALAERLEELGKSLGAREAAYAAEVDAAQGKAAELHAQIAGALERFHAAAAAAGAPHLQIELSGPRTDDKHLRATEIELRRGKHVAIVTVKSRGDLTLVGPFRTGKAEGPCRSYPFAPGETSEEVESALTDFLGRFLEEAATP